VWLRVDGESWLATLEASDGRQEPVRAKCVANAAGPWVADFLDNHTPLPARHHPRMIQGSHIVLRKLFDHPYAYLFQAPDGRVVFAIPFEREFTLVGTTEREYRGDLARPAISATETQYLVDMVNRYFRRELTPRDVVWTFAGLRPLLAASTQDPKSVTRDYVLDLQQQGPPLLSVYGGKLTTYRRLAEEVVARVLRVLGLSAPRWTEHVPLPGGDIAGGDFEGFRTRLARKYQWLDRGLLWRYARAYGTRIDRLLDDCSGMADLGREILPGLHEREIEYLRREEFAQTAEDILFRRSKLGLHAPRAGAAKLDAWLAGH
jgi:glycerol-3-phosphate dehydrogenase